jgi:UDP-N-acetylglucosamine--N-acetylmuramyl-(pentapeptide) pyrophosphoryl-undecaprenol N-acetylglucosamine transferase
MTDGTDNPSADDALALVTGGGSGGHVMPALATTRRLQQRPGIEIVYVGSHTGIEREVAVEAGLEYHAITTGKLRRARRWWGLFTRENIADIFNVLRGLWQSRRLVRKLNPAVVLATGGFVTVPVVWAARMRRIPIVLHEQTVQFGLANRLCAPAATRIALATELSYESMRSSWRDKSTVTGNPIRPEVLDGDVERGAERFAARPGRPTILVTGGAQGAEAINRAVRDALPALLEVCNVVHVCGAGKGLETTRTVLEAAAAEVAPGTPGAYHVTEFMDATALGDAYALAALVLSRSGAGTTNELAGVGRPAVLVPLVPTGGDEQRKIARRFADAGAALIVPTNELDAQRLLAEVTPLIGDGARLAEMSAAARTLAPGDAAGRLADLVLEAVAMREPPRV